MCSVSSLLGPAFAVNSLEIFCYLLQTLSDFAYTSIFYATQAPAYIRSWTLHEHYDSHYGHHI